MKREQALRAAYTALSEYTIGLDGVTPEVYDMDLAFTDLLADLRHLADLHGVDFDQALERADLHYGAEGTDEVRS